MIYLCVSAPLRFNFLTTKSHKGYTKSHKGSGILIFFASFAYSLRPLRLKRHSSPLGITQIRHRGSLRKFKLGFPNYKETPQLVGSLLVKQLLKVSSCQFCSFFLLKPIRFLGSCVGFNNWLSASKIN